MNMFTVDDRCQALIAVPLWWICLCSEMKSRPFCDVDCQHLYRRLSKSNHRQSSFMKPIGSRHCADWTERCDFWEHISQSN